MLNDELRYNVPWDIFHHFKDMEADGRKYVRNNSRHRGIIQATPENMTELAGAAEYFGKQLLKFQASSDFFPVRVHDLEDSWTEREMRDFRIVMYCYGLLPRDQSSLTQKESDLGRIVQRAPLIRSRENCYALANPIRFATLFTPIATEILAGVNAYIANHYPNEDPAIAIAQALEPAVIGFGIGLAYTIWEGADFKLRIYKNPFERVEKELNRRAAYVEKFTQS